ncbi:UHRF1-binding protein 1-like isoform X2 [Pangasianodon hypophthalmus]|uniref:UHRF1-binding protein 1-like isoform X2 n=1 Tax=Pangasianodon hypophthalmus TaxID=310915 RepID=UPI0023079C93|nr:UHRF1-binding protein 1-like isoform X2 [Pangasianodon hypophthalmus]
MAGLIKKQILKHLSRFAKNLSPDKINLSTLKGEGQLTNLELDEEVLQNMLDLPTWLAITKVFCNKAAIRIPWTKLKTHPITLSLDKVVMEMSTCDEPRPPNGPSPIATASGQSEYGFAEKVVEGISLSVNSIIIRISAKAFNASFELSQLQVYSVNTSWVTSDLRYTRIQDPARGEILTFKEVSWQMIRIEADAIQSSEHEVLSAPIRLITNQSKIRVTLKRRMKDCHVVASKLILILDDLLWVLTDSQLKAMVQYAKSLSEAMEKSALQRKSMAPDSSQQVHIQQASAATDPSASMAHLFNAFDVCETSHHLQITHLDLHICDDIHAKDRGIDKRIQGGAMQLSFSSITIDYYPFHRAGETCQHWMHYSDATKTREGWARSLLEEYRSNMEMLKNAISGQSQCSPQHGKISTSTSTSFSQSPSPRAQLMSSSIVLRMADFSIYQVSTADQRRTSPKAMISCNKKTLYLPQEMPAIHLEFTEYYFPDGKDHPIPCPNLYVQLNALQLVVDAQSLVWLNLFALDLHHSLVQFMELYKLNDSQKPDEHIDVRVDGLMLKLVIPCDQKQFQPDQPRSISVQTSEMLATNTRHSPGCSRSDLEALLQAFREQAFFTSSTSSSFPVLHPVFQRHAHERDTCLHDVYRGLAPPTLSTDALKTPSATDLWALRFTQFWVDYEGPRNHRPSPCVDSFPLTLWLCQPARYVQHQQRPKAGADTGTLATDVSGRLQRKKLLKEYYSTETLANQPTNGLHKPFSLDGLNADDSSSVTSSSSSSPGDADVQVLVQVQKLLSAQASHSQYVFLLKLQQTLNTLQRTLQQDLQQHGLAQKGTGRTFGACVGLLVSSAEVALLLKPIPTADADSSPLGSELSPSGSRATLEVGSEAGDSTAGTAKLTCPVEQMLCVDTEIQSQSAPPLLPFAAPSRTEKKSSTEEKNAWSGPEEKRNGADGFQEGKELKLEPKVLQSEASLGRTMAVDAMGEPISRDWNDKSQGARLPQSMSSGRLMRDRSQSTFSVTYKNMKKSPSLQSLDNISIDSSLLEDYDSYSLERDDVSISGFKVTLSDPSAAERATEVVVQDGENAQSPEAVSATSQSTDEHAKDLVSVLVLKVHSVCASLTVRGDNTTLALEVGQVRTNQLGNVSLRQYLSNHSLGFVCSTPLVTAQSSEGSASDQEPCSKQLDPEVRLRLVNGPEAAAHSPLAEHNGFLQCQLQAFSTDFLMTSLRNLATFLEDDSTSQVLPMEITIQDSHINLKDDGPRDSPSESEPTPMSLHIHNLLVLRRDDGSFHIGVEHAAQVEPQEMECVPDSQHISAPEVCGAVAREPKATQTEPLSPTGPFPSVREKMLVEENECLKLELSKTKMALAEAQMEKDSLLHRMKNIKLNTGGSTS